MQHGYCDRKQGTPFWSPFFCHVWQREEDVAGPPRLVENTTHSGTISHFATEIPGPMIGGVLSGARWFFR